VDAAEVCFISTEWQKEWHLNAFDVGCTEPATGTVLAVDWAEVPYQKLSNLIFYCDWHKICVSPPPPLSRTSPITIFNSVDVTG